MQQPHDRVEDLLAADPVDDAVVVGQGELHHLADREVTVVVDVGGLHCTSDTEDRRQSINFSDPYHVTVYGLMTLPDSPYAGGTTINDFSGASILGQKDTMLDTVIDQMEGVNHLPPVDSVPNMISRLDQGTCDAIVINLENSTSYLELNPDYNIIEFAEGDGFELGFNGSCVGLRKSDDQLLADVDAALATYTQEDFDELWNWAVENQPN